jgi:ABC-2 type transport system permease protein
MPSRVASVIARRRTLWLLVRRDLKVRYADSVLGYLWTVLDPFMMALVYFFVFTQIFTGRRVGAQPYILFLLFGLLAWNWTSGTITEASRALTAEAKIVRSSNLVREIWVLRIVLSKFLEYVFALPVLAAFAVVYALHGRIGFGSPTVTHGPYLSWYLLAFPLALIVHFLMLTGLGLILAPITVLFNDTQRVVRIFLRIYFYLSPVIYGTQNVPASVRPFFALNPLCGIFDLYRASLFPNQFAGWHVFAVSAAISILLLFLGSLVFRRFEGAVLKEI